MMETLSGIAVEIVELFILLLFRLHILFKMSTWKLIQNEESKHAIGTAGFVLLFINPTSHVLIVSV